MIELPLSEQFRIVAKKWVDEDAAAGILEDTKTTLLAQKKAALIEEEGEMPDAHAERIVKASSDWVEHLIEIREARTRANKTKLQLEYIRMRHSEQMSAEATGRMEARL